MLLKRNPEELLISAGGIPADIQNRVAKVLEDIQAEGQAAVLRYTEQFDHVKVESLSVPRAFMAEAYLNLPALAKKALELAHERVSQFYRGKRPQSRITPGADGLVLGEIWQPLCRVGVYIPGGSAPLFSTVLMTAVVAREAGVDEIVLVTPPRADGLVDPYLLAACYLAGVHELYTVGGAQAIGALAYGTEEIKPVEKIVGPGNIYVTAAKKLVYGSVDLDSLAGPSEVLIYADRSANPQHVAADLLAQAEHDPRARAILVVQEEAVALAVKDALVSQMEKLGRYEVIEASLTSGGGYVVFSTEVEVLQFINQLGPEHLGLMVSDPWALLGRIRHAGAIFLGHFAPEALGDYIAGPSHVLPTGGTATYASSLGVETFGKRSSLIYAGKEGYDRLASSGALLADKEGLSAHAHSLRVRGEH